MQEECTVKPKLIYHLICALAVGAFALIATSAPQGDGAGAGVEWNLADARQAFMDFMILAPVTR
jgi:hypothetical protein